MAAPGFTFRRLAGAAAVLAAGAMAGCAVHSEPISERSEKILEGRRVSAEKIGFRLLPGGTRYQMQLFRAKLPTHPVTMPMERSVARLPSATLKLNRRVPVRMILDTGAQLSVIEASAAISAKADVFAPKEGALRVAGVGGEEKAWLASFERIPAGCDPIMPSQPRNSSSYEGKLPLWKSVFALGVVASTLPPFFT